TAFSVMVNVCRSSTASLQKTPSGGGFRFLFTCFYNKAFGLIIRSPLIQLICASPPFCKRADNASTRLCRQQCKCGLRGENTIERELSQERWNVGASTTNAYHGRAPTEAFCHILNNVYVQKERSVSHGGQSPKLFR